MKNLFLEAYDNYMQESENSDLYEIRVAENINSYFESNNMEYSASRPKVDTSYSDILVTNETNKHVAWIEVKMNHTDNLYNKRFQFINGLWKPMSQNIVGDKISDFLNNDEQATQWIEDLAEFTGKDKTNLYLPSIAKSKKFPEKAVQLDKLIEFLQTHSRNITTIDGIDVKQLVIDHYCNGGKSEPAAYLQSGDDFYQMKQGFNPLKFKDLPILEKISTVDLIPVFRISVRSSGYELLTTLKFKYIASSKYSFMPGSKKAFPTIK